MIATIILMVLVNSPVTQARNANGSRFLSLREALDISVRRNPSLKLMDIKIQKAKLDIEQQFIDVQESELMVKQKKLALLAWQNQRQTIMNNVKLDVHNKYYQCVIAVIRLSIAKEDLKYAGEYLEDSKKNYREGKIHKVQLRQIEEIFKQKEEEEIMSRGELRRAKLALLLSINERLGARIAVAESIGENIRELRLKDIRRRVLTNNRNIRAARLKYSIKKMESSLVDESLMSKNDIRKARYDLDEAAIELEEEIRQQNVEAVSRYLIVRDMEARMITAEKRLKRARLGYLLASKRYRDGYINKQIYHNSDMDYKRMRLTHETMVQNYNIAKLRLFFLLN
ncbi:MAG: TolC family protein [Spirochaetota bacterium]|nr:TolC family protein [Spirochaetota bacterium]